MKSFLIPLLLFCLSGLTYSQYFESPSESECIKVENNHSEWDENENMNYERGPANPGDDVPIDESLFLLVFISLGLGIYFQFLKVKTKNTLIRKSKLN